MVDAAKRAFAKLCGLGTLCGLTTPLSASAEPRVSTAPAQRFRLQNGLEVLLQDNHLQPEVAIVVAYEIGSRDDPEELPGLAHVVEHLTFRQTRHLQKDHEGFDLLQRAGAEYVQGLTSPDYTAYQVVVPPSGLGLALWIESERMAFALERFNERNLRLELDIVRREMTFKQRVEPVFRRHAFNAVFGRAHPYFDGDGQVGPIELEHAQSFFQLGYRPANARLIVVGDFDGNATRAAIERYFGPIRNPRRSFVRQRGALPAFGDVGRVIFEQQVARDAVLAIWGGPGASSRQALALRAFARGFSDFLVRQLVEREQLVESVDIGLLDLDLEQLLLVDLRLPRRTRGPNVEERLAREFLAVWKLDWSKLLARVKARMLLGDIRRQEQPLSTAMAHLQELRVRGQPFDLEGRVHAISGLKPADILGLRHELTLERTLIAHLLRPLPNTGVGERGRLTVVDRKGGKLVGY